MVGNAFAFGGKRRVGVAPDDDLCPRQIVKQGR